RGRDGRRGRARTDPRRDDRTCPQRADGRRRRAIRGGQGGPRRLLPLRVRLDRRGVRVGRRDPRREDRRDRGSAGAPRPGGGAPVRYALLIYTDQSQWSAMTPDEAAAARAESLPRWYSLFEELGKVDAGANRFELDSATEAK